MNVERPITHDDPDITIVIPTLPVNSHDQVVDDLHNQTHDAVEVIVVNDPEKDICEARNAGIEAASAPIVALTDDDCRPPAVWVERIVAAFEANPQLVCLEGSVRGGRTYDGKRKYVGCNLAFNRKEALAVGGFDSDYAGWRDDTEFGWRMERDAEGHCMFLANVEMIHPNKPRARIDKGNENRLQAGYPGKYNKIILPNTLLGRFNDWLWRWGFWDAVDRIRT
ncbi:glycosyltransferase family 2 protein [Halosolutus amylolyticus]|uniref:Glycosyltransferase family 2 protein n=1 Tax=Halosolutus amylolyticus TaxID=2932267 RepID=A0ABD5PSK0_9EURY|nr:glycosyltransferase family A protein [Halosolutus amylolyticus]